MANYLDNLGLYGFPYCLNYYFFINIHNKTNTMKKKKFKPQIFNRSSFADSIHEQKKGDSFKLIAEKIGVSVDMLYRASKEQNISIDGMLKICDFYGWSICDFIDNDLAFLKSY